MSVFVQSMKRLYSAGKVTDDKIESLLTGGKITQEEADYITA